MSNQDLDEIVLRYKDMVYRIAMLRMKNVSDADDVFQEVFVRLVRHVGQLESEEHVKAWLIRVTINCCNSFYADTFRKRTVSYDDALEKNIEDSGPDGDGSAEACYAAADAYPAESSDGSVLAAVRRLPASYRDVIYLFYYESLSIRGIAQTLEVREGAVKTRLFRARDMLKSELKDVEL